MLGFVRFMHGPSKRLHALHCMGNERAAGASGNYPTVAALKKVRLNPAFDFLELLTERRFAHPQALGGLSHIALFMQDNDQFEIANSALACGHDLSISAHTNPCASPRQAGRSHSSLIPPEDDEQVKSGLYSHRPYLLQFDTIIAI
jgi:hypothetical protein